MVLFVKDNYSLAPYKSPSDLHGLSAQDHGVCLLHTGGQ